KWTNSKMIVNHAAFEEGRRSQRITKYCLYPRQSSEQQDYQVLSENIPSLFEEDVRMIQNKEEIPFWVEEKGKAWAKVPKLLVNTPQLLFALSGHHSAEQISAGDDTFQFFDDDWLSLPSDQYGTNSYDAFGILIKTGDDTILHFYRVGTSHANDKGKIVKRTYTISTNSWSSASDVFEDATYDCRSATGGIIGNEIFLFFTRYNHSTDTFVDINYIKSTDLTGTSWGSRVIMTTSTGWRFNPHSHLESLGGGTYIQPWFEHNGAGTWHAGFYKTVDSGVNWTNITIYSGSTYWGEPSIANIGDNKLIAIFRNVQGGYLGQATSSDNGDNWSAVTATNLGLATGDKIPYLIYDAESGNVIAMFHDRGDDKSKVSETDADTVFASASSWNTSEVLDSGFNHNGYHSIVKIASGKYFYVYSKQMSSADADIWGGEYPLKWESAGSPSVSGSVIHLSDDDALLGATAFGYNHAVVARAKADEQDIRFIMFGDGIALHCPNRLVIANSDGVDPDVFDRFYYSSAKEGSGAPPVYTDAADFRGTYYNYEIRRISGQADFYQGSSFLGSHVNAEHLPIVDLFPKMIVWDSSQESTLDIDWVLVRKYTSPDCLVLKKRTSGNADVIKAIVSGLLP
ncbi:MAG: sialidase family protein, partial [Patescibacteria group bacterium]|nr:sialidase family protein [Patescibacteria group bacterium]